MKARYSKCPEAPDGTPLTTPPREVEEPQLA